MDTIKIDRKGTALVIIDLQKGIGSTPTMPHSFAEVVENTSRLVRQFRKEHMEIFFVHVAFSREGGDSLHPVSDQQGFRRAGEAPSDWADFVDELDVREDDHIITKRQWGAFYGTDLDLQLRRRGIGTIVLCGIATNFGVESTARFAYEYGYQQIFVEDAMSARSKEEHDNSIKFILSRIGRVRSTNSVLDALQ